MSLPLFHGTRWPTVTFVDSMTISFRVKGDSVCSYGGSLSDPSRSFALCLRMTALQRKVPVAGSSHTHTAGSG